ncbi:HAMP domain-containing histidine kinase [Pedobacter sp. BS3]|uniref:sensor histidine kinase n=1 Tax=Pedobacter sp. BS3 TaxID=2567937 RepID=UPI0011F04B4F|nr:HAMP domain-containing sensor histidine kinase [Pedobacter sp. BS3]TZF82266.1 HAMP domain-containing histidine kinase [Pedobacter sp. BS3]
MKLQHKLALYNTFTKIAVIAILGVLIIAFIDRISTSNLQQRLIDKRNKLVSHLSDEEIEELLNKQSTFTDYNILKEEYIELNEVSDNASVNTAPVFTKEKRKIEDETQDYLVLANYFSYGGKTYRLEIGETMLALDRLENTIMFYTLIILLASVILTLAADLAFTRFLLAPFYRIIDQKLNKVDDPIHFNYDYAHTTTDDFRLLDSSINKLMQRISDQLLNQKQFITNVSHELLTPISILRTRLENLLNQPDISEENLNKISASLRTLNRLKAITNSLLLISKIENQQFNKTDRVSMPALIADIYEELEDRIASRNITFENRLQHNFGLTGNQALLHTLCINLINNAIKYNKDNGKIIISDNLTNHSYQLYITDKGIGMDNRQIEQAFNRFAKFNATDTESYGLGLAIVQSIAAFHDISISISSEIGQGTRIGLEFKTH